MTFLPIVERELRVAARRRGTWWMRLGVALLSTGVGAVVFLLTLGLLSPQQTGQFIFRGLSGMLLLYCFAYGRRATADCLSVEKRDGTLGLLFLTDLKGHDVVLGKLFATSLGGFYGLLAVVPVLSGCLLLGGVTSGEFWRMVLVLLDTFLLSLAIGMLGSSLSKTFRQAMAANFLLMLAIVAVAPAIAAAFAFFSSTQKLLPPLLYSCPIYSYFLSFDSSYKAGSTHFWSSVAVIHVLTWLLVFLASTLIPRAFHEQPVRATRRPWRELWKKWSFGPESERAVYRKRLLDVNAFYWLAARARLKPLHVWTFLGFLALWWMIGCLTSGQLWFDESQFVLTALMLNFTFKVWVVIEAGQELADDQKSGAVELLLSVPLSVREILRGQLLALKRQFLKPLLLVFGLEVLFLFLLRRRNQEAQALFTWLAGLLMLLADLSALVWVAMLRALCSRSHNQATISTLARVLVLPWVIFGVVVAAINAWFAYSPSSAVSWLPDWQFYLSLWFGLGLAADIGFGLHAWRQLHFHFRALALRRFSPSPSRFIEWWRHTWSAIRDSALFSEPQKGAIRHRQGWKYYSKFVLFLVFVGVACWFVLKPIHRFPPPQIITVHNRKQNLQVIPTPGGAYFLLPDGSLWRWGQVGGLQLPRTAVLERIGTNSNWAQISGAAGHCVALQNDGSLWEWGSRGPHISMEPQRVDSRHDWVAVSASYGHAAALRNNGTLWTWGINPISVPVGGAWLDQTNLVQVGTNTNWVAVKCYWACTLGLRSDGTLWVWGEEFFANTPLGRRMTANSVPVPTKVCSDKNWTGFAKNISPLVINRSGELWDPFLAPANPNASASGTCRRIAGSDQHTALAFAGSQQEIYQIQPDGTLWKADYPGVINSPQPAKWNRVGRRSDWVELWSGGGIAFGRTRDGMLWTWGLDPSREPVASLGSRLAAARMRFRAWSRTTPGFVPTGTAPPYTTEPRPLLNVIEK